MRATVFRPDIVDEQRANATSNMVQLIRIAGEYTGFSVLVTKLMLATAKPVAKSPSLSRLSKDFSRRRLTARLCVIGMVPYGRC